MTVAELIEHLQRYPAHREVMLQDGIGPRTCSAPYTHVITQEDGENVGDCEERAGELVVAMYAS